MPPSAPQRAVRLLERYFAAEEEGFRRVVFNRAFDGVTPDPRLEIQFGGSARTFATHAVDKLIAFGATARGRHCASRLISTMAEMRGRQSDPDYYDLPRELDAACSLPTREEEQRYLARLIKEAEAKARLYSPLQAIAQTHPAHETEPALFAWQDDPHLVHLRHDPRSLRHFGEPEKREYLDILSAFGQVKRAALLGPPGAGKSTTLRRLAVDLARNAQTDPAAPLPLFVEMGKWTGPESLTVFLANAAPEIGWAAEALSRERRLVLLLDGINEIPTTARADKAAGLHTTASSLHRVFVSCRREDYAGDLDLGLDTLTLEPLSPRRIRDAVRQWIANANQPAQLAEQFFWQLAGGQRLAALLEKWLAAGASEDQFWSASDPKDHEGVYKKTTGVEDELWRDHVGNPRSLMRLAANPFMLTMLFHVWWGNKKELPRNRSALFNQFIKVLLSREHLTPSDGSRLLTGLAALAWRMQRERKEPGEAGVLTVAPRSAALEELGAEDLLKKALDATILEGTEELRFRHQLLQEYFTAQALQERLGQTGAAELWPAERWWERSGWEETAVLLAGLHSEDCGAVIRWLGDAQPEVAAQCIEESGAGIADREALLGELQRKWLPRLTGEAKPQGRAAVGRALNRLKLDTRKGVGVTAEGVPEIEWVEIPASEFVYQEEAERRRNERFYIARYPVTNGQYQAFLEASDGYRDDRWWQEFPEADREPSPPRWTEANHPRERVNWYEAMAFCGWVSHRMGLGIRLPEEWEWERAARGREGREYPWGEYREGHANINRELGRTSPVGMYPEGGSVEGVLDMSGNVWEWCVNEYEAGEEPRVLRGGSWYFIQDLARAAYRNRNLPDNRDLNVGFRVVCSSPIAGH